jgi:hypothetical protein
MIIATLKTVVPAQAGTHAERAVRRSIFSIGSGLRRNDGFRVNGFKVDGYGFEANCFKVNGFGFKVDGEGKMR